MKRGVISHSHYSLNYRRYYNTMTAELRVVVDRLCQRNESELSPSQVQAEAVDVVMREVEKPCQCRKCREVSLEDRLADL